MRKPRVKVVVYRDSFTSTLKRIFSYRLVLLSVVLMVVGLVLFVVSLQSNSIVSSSYVQNSSTQVHNSTYSKVYFGQYSHLKSSIAFTMPDYASVHYSVYKVDNYSSEFSEKSQKTLVKSGYVHNNSVVGIGSTKLPQGQEYVLMIKSSGVSTFNIHVSITENVFVTEHADRSTGGPGVIFGMAGSMLLSANVDRIYRGLRAV